MRRPLALLALALVACKGDDTDVTDTDVVDTDVAPTAHLVVDDGFESPAQDAGGGYETLLPTGWELWVSSPAFTAVGLLRPSGATMTQVEPLAAPGDGNQLLWLYVVGDGVVAQSMSVTRTVVDVAEAGQTYTLRLALGRRLDLEDVDGVEVSLGVHQGAIADPTPTPFTELALTPATDLPKGSLQEIEVAWTADAAHVGFPVTARVSAWSNAGTVGQHQILVDHVRAWIGTPE